MKRPTYKKERLNNELRIVTYQMPATKSVTIEVAIKAGPRYESGKNAGTAHFLEHMLFEGTKRFPSAKELALYLESVGGRSGAWTSKESVVYYVKVPSQHLEVAFDYLSEILFNSLVAEEAIEKEKKIVLEELHRMVDNVERYIWDVWMEWVWGKQQAIGRPTIGYKETIQSFTKDGLTHYLQSLYHPKNMVIGIAGNFPHDKVRTHAAKYFGNIPLNQTKTRFTKTLFTPKDRLVLILHRDTQQAHLILGFATGISYLHPDRFPVRVVTDILSSGVSSRLFHRLVYELGLAYSAGAQSWLFADTGLFYTYGGFSPEKLNEAVAVIVDELQRLKREKVSKRELKEAKEKDKAQVLFSLETSDAMADYLATTELLENRIITTEELGQLIDNVEAEEIQRVAKKYFTRKNLCITIVGPIKKRAGSQLERSFHLL